MPAFDVKTATPISTVAYDDRFAVGDTSDDGWAAVTTDGLLQSLVTRLETAELPVVVKAPASPTVPLFRAKNNAGTVVASVNELGHAVFCGDQAEGKMLVGNLAVDRRYTCIWFGAAAASPTFANATFTGLDDGYNPAYTLFNASGSGGRMAFRQGNSTRFGLADGRAIFTHDGLTGSTIPGDSNANVSVVSSAPGTKPLVVQAAASQTANLTEWQDDGGTPVASVSAVGAVTCAELSGHRVAVAANAGTSITLGSANTGRVVETTASAGVSVTLSETATVGTSLTVTQAGTGQVTFSAGSGGSLRNRQSHTKTAGQWAVVAVYVRANSGGSAAEWVLSGDTAA